MTIGPARNLQPIAPGAPERRTVVVCGDIDMTSLPALRRRLANALGRVADAVPRHLVIDLSRVSQCTTAGLALFVDTGRRAKALGGSMALAGPRPQVMHLLRVTGLDQRLTVQPGPQPPLRREPGFAKTHRAENEKPGRKR